MDVGVRELKKRLSEFLERAARGEVIRVTDRGEPKAVLGPLPGKLLLEQGIAEGWIKRGASTPPRPAPRARSKRSVMEALGADRDEDE